MLNSKDADPYPAFAFGGQVAGRIGGVLPVAEIIHATVAGFYDEVLALGRYLP